MRTLKTILKLLKEYEINYEDIVAIDNQGGVIRLDKLDTKNAKLTTDGVFGDFLVETKGDGKNYKLFIPFSSDLFYALGGEHE
ncbi:MULTISPECIES: hypothetical protein [unclassified Campylobacter]|uniref:hypothetical protein n=1 Tax=unclassified Campylobacter TaxID=2593542 RepID=UPI003D34F153